MQQPSCQIYLITPPIIEDLEGFSTLLCQALEADTRGHRIPALQIRLKDVPDAHIIKVTQTLMPLCWERNVAVIMNDHVHLAKSLACDGVHLGQQDMPITEARKILGPKAMIGVTCHNSRHLAIEAAENSADYVAFGAFFPTSTKEVEHRADPDILRIWQDFMHTPCVAIGGINAQNATIMAENGADFIAVSSYIWTHPQGPAAAVRELQRSIQKL